MTNFLTHSRAFLVAAASVAFAAGTGDAPRAPAETRDVTYRIPGTDVTFEMVELPAGTFQLGWDGRVDPEGSNGSDRSDESPPVDVFVSGFLIGKHEVTYDEYAILQNADRDTDSTLVEGRFMDLDAVARPSTPYEDPAHGMGGFGHPAVGMTQWAALQYARWLSEKTGEFFRLPTEAEWEYACRAGTGSAYPNGTTEADLSRSAWYFQNADYTLHEVGEKAPNPWGIHDMQGNAAEWTLDQYQADYYATLQAAGAVDPWRRPDRLHPRTVRGGSYDDESGELRCSARRESTLNWKRRDPQIPKSFWWNTDSPFVGFRLVRPLEQPTPEEQEDFWLLVLGE